jgi:hypothetical protein
LQPTLPEGHPEQAAPSEESFGAGLDATIAWYSDGDGLMPWDGA